MDGTGEHITTFFVEGIPAPQGSKTAVMTKTGPRVIEGSSTTGRVKYKNWRADVAAAALVHKNKHRLTPADGPLSLYVEFVMPRPGVAKKKTWVDVKPDLSKLIRSTEDSLTGHLIRDDALIVVIMAGKRYAVGDEPTGAKISLYRV